MNKKYILILLPLILLLVGCGNNNVVNNNSNVDSDKKSIELIDEKKGLKTTLFYDNNIAYSQVDVDSERANEGESIAIEFDNDSLDVEIDAFYMSSTFDEYNAYETKYSNDDNYSKVRFNVFDGFTYGNSDDELNMLVILRSNRKEKKYDLLKVTISRLDDDEKVIVSEVFKGKELQDLFGSLRFEVISN